MVRGAFSEDDSGGTLWGFDEDKSNSLEGEWENTWGGGVNNSFDEVVNESEEGKWGYKDSENDCYEKDLWTIDLDWK